MVYIQEQDAQSAKQQETKCTTRQVETQRVQSFTIVQDGEKLDKK